MAERQIQPFSEDALNRFRITHSDRDLRPLLRRLHRFPHLSSIPPTADASSQMENQPGGHSEADIDREKDMLRMELLKWRAGIERLLGSVRNLERQKASYSRRATETGRRINLEAEGMLMDSAAETEALRASLIADQALLESKKRERDHMIRCDEVAAKITSRGRTRAELDEAIAELQASLVDHRASHGLYLQTAQARIDTFSQVSALVEEVRTHKLPLDPQASIEDAIAGGADTAMDVDDSAVASSSSGKLNAQALPFQPAPASSVPTSRAGSPPIPPARPPGGNSTLPARPARTVSSATTSSVPQRSSGTNTRAASSTLPSRPSALRSVTQPAGRAGHLEEGEVGGEEDGEVSEDHGKRRAGEDGRSARSSTRAKR